MRCYVSSLPISPHAQFRVTTSRNCLCHRTVSQCVTAQNCYTKLSSSSSLHVSRWLVYSSASLHLFNGRLRFLFPAGIPSCTFFTSRSSAILDICSLHSVLLLCTHEVMFWISHNSLILSFRTLSSFVFL